MKRLALIRHAKSSWKDSSVPDLLRPLSKRGRRDAPIMGERLSRAEFDADTIVSSPATRALTTAEIIAAEIAYPAEEIVLDDRVYEATAGDLAELIAELDESLESVVVVGHNPGLTDLIDAIAPHLLGSMPTCAIVRFSFDCGSWQESLATAPTETDYDSPRLAGLRR